jgi:hypothetical protein
MKNGGARTLRTADLKARLVEIRLAPLQFRGPERCLVIDDVPGHGATDL